ncbi:MAG: hypothetical protein JWO60_3197, partial [Frankiales bacterium]|nr:hypothetical protein [Frankiales bacterium]
MTDTLGDAVRSAVTAHVEAVPVDAAALLTRTVAGR